MKKNMLMSVLAVVIAATSGCATAQTGRPHSNPWSAGDWRNAPEATPQDVENTANHADASRNNAQAVVVSNEAVRNTAYTELAVQEFQSAAELQRAAMPLQKAGQFIGFVVGVAEAGLNIATRIEDYDKYRNADNWRLVQTTGGYYATPNSLYDNLFSSGLLNRWSNTTRIASSGQNYSYGDWVGNSQVLDSWLQGGGRSCVQPNPYFGGGYGGNRSYSDAQGNQDVTIGWIQGSGGQRAPRGNFGSFGNFGGGSNRSYSDAQGNRDVTIGWIQGVR